MKRTCTNCRAFQALAFNIECLLKHKIKTIVVPTSLGVPLLRGQPLEECEKPMTNDAFLAALQTRKP